MWHYSFAISYSYHRDLLKVIYCHVCVFSNVYGLFIEQSAMKLGSQHYL